MKDYTLSEIKAICDDCVGDCDFCQISYECDSLGIEKYPTHWENIEQRDMIELPCKLPAVSGKQLQVVYRDKYGYVRSKPYDLDEEPEADAFLADLKGESNGN